MSRETRAVLGIILAVVFLGLKLAARSSRSRNTAASNYADVAKQLERDRMMRELAEREAEARKAEQEDEELRDSLYAEHCQTDQSSELMLEVECASPTFNALAPLLAQDLLPEGASWPKPTKVAGVEVQVLHRGREPGTNPTCLDADAQLIKRVRGSLKLADAQGRWVDGALVVKTTDSSAAQLLLASDVKETIGGHGPVVAFVGSDNLAVFADGSDPKALDAAAKASARGIDPTASLGCSLIEPMVLTGDTWSKWRPPAGLEGIVQAHRRVVNACLLELVQDSISAVAQVRPDLGPFPQGLETLTERRFDPTRGTIARVSFDRLKGPQLLLQADQIELAHNDGRLSTLLWPVFQRAAKKALTPVNVAGKPCPEAWLFDPELVASLDTASDASFAALK